MKLFRFLTKFRKPTPVPETPLAQPLLPSVQTPGERLHEPTSLATESAHDPVPTTESLTMNGVDPAARLMRLNAARQASQVQIIAHEIETLMTLQGDALKSLCDGSEPPTELREMYA